IRPEHLHDGTTDIYLCGPPPMVEAVRGFLDDEGLQVTHFYYEKFTPATAVPDQSAERATESAEPTEEAALAVDPSPSTPETETSTTTTAAAADIPVAAPAPVAEPVAPAAATTAPAAPHGPA